MAAGRGAKGGRRNGPKSGGRGTTGGRGRSATPRSRPAKPPRTADADAPPVPPLAPSGPFRLGAVAGTTPGKWIDIWHERMPETPLELIALEVAGQRDALATAAVDAALVRLPIDRDGLHVIPLYDEVPVVVCAADSHLTAADELTVDDLEGEVVIVPRDSVVDVDVPGAEPAAFDPPATTEEAIATVAAGVGVVIVPMSLARLHHRKDAEFRPLAGGPVSTVALAWSADDVSGGVATFVGIVRGRTPNSSRG